MKTLKLIKYNLMSNHTHCTATVYAFLGYVMIGVLITVYVGVL